MPSVNGKIGIPFISLMDPCERGGMFYQKEKREEMGRESTSYVSNVRNGDNVSQMTLQQE